MLSVHAAISAADAACVKRAGMRAAGQAHADAVRLVRQLFPGDADADRASSQLGALIDRKNTIEYEARRARPDEATTAVSRAERGVRWADEVIQG